jgi:hypothetical protein
MKELETHLTLHLYRKDEALAAMRWAIITHNYIELAFWGIELYDSDMQGDSLEILEYIWATSIGFGSWTSIARINEIYTTGEVDRKTWLELLISFARVHTHDSSALYLLIRGLIEPIEWKPVFSHSNDYTSIIDAHYECLYRGKIVEAWLLGRALLPETQWLHLEKILTEKNIDRANELEILKTLSLPTFHRLALAYILINLTSEQWVSSQLPLNIRVPDEVLKSLKTWDLEKSMRKRREFRPKAESMVFLCKRSNQPTYESSEDDIQKGLEENLRESPYWKSILCNYMKNDIWLDREGFYDNFFPDDIPDEWSQNDREMSHGRGLGKSSENAQQRFIDHIFQRSTSIGIWNPIDNMNISNCNIHNIDTAYITMQSTCNNKLESYLPFRAIKKQFEII